MWYQVHREKEQGEYSVLLYIPNFLDISMYNYVKKWLSDNYTNDNFKGGEGVIGKEVPRKQIWFQENGEYFCKNWKGRLDRWKSENYSDNLREIQNYIQSRIIDLNLENILKSSLTDDYNPSYIDFSPKLNSCLVNLYRDGNDSIHAHRDCVDSFGMYPTIIGLSVGVTRTMRITKIVYNEDNIKSMKPDKSVYETITKDTDFDIDEKHITCDKKGLMMDFELEDNSVFIMMGASQKYYTHEIIKEPDIQDKRYSITFRKWKGK
jgi:alkylated DNA repair dioxygenase AlkB